MILIFSKASFSVFRHLTAYQEPVEDSDEDSDSDTDDDPAAGGAVRICAQPETVDLEVASEDTDPTEDLELNTTG